MSEELYIKFGNEARSLIDQLTDMFGTEDPAAIVAHALGFAVAVKDFAHDGAVTVVDPFESDDIGGSGESDSLENSLVNIVVNPNDRPKQPVAERARRAAAASH